MFQLGIASLGATYPFPILGAISTGVSGSLWWEFSVSHHPVDIPKTTMSNIYLCFRLGGCIDLHKLRNIKGSGMIGGPSRGSERFPK
jgi:hypothetical protein